VRIVTLDSPVNGCQGLLGTCLGGPLLDLSLHEAFRNLSAEYYQKYLKEAQRSHAAGSTLYSVANQRDLVVLFDSASPSEIPDARKLPISACPVLDLPLCHGTVFSDAKVLGWVTQILTLSPAPAAPTATTPAGPAPNLMGGSIPQGGGLGLGVFSGGTIAQLVTASGCNSTTAAFYLYVQSLNGKVVTYLAGAPDFVNADFYAALPGGVIPPMTPFVGTCGSGPPPAPVVPPSNPLPPGQSGPTSIPDRPGFPTRIETANAVFFGDLEMPEPTLTRWAQAFEEEVVPTLTRQTGLKRMPADQKAVFLIYGARYRLEGGAVGLVGRDEFGDFIGIAADPANNLGRVNPMLMRHEFFHFAASKYGAAFDLPLWLNEGLAFVLSFADGDNIDTNVAESPVASGWREVREGTLDVSDIRALPYGGPQIAATHNLLKSHGGVASVRQYFRAISMGFRHPEAFSSAFGLSEGEYSAEFLRLAANPPEPVPGRFGTIMTGQNANWRWSIGTPADNRTGASGALILSVAALDDRGQGILQDWRWTTDGKTGFVIHEHLPAQRFVIETRWLDVGAPFGQIAYYLYLVPGATGFTTITIKNLSSAVPDLVIQYPLP